MNVTNIDQAVAVLKSLKIDVHSTGASIQFNMEEYPSMNIIKQLNKAKIVIYDLGEK